VQTAIREHNVYCRTEPKTIAGCKYNRAMFHYEDILIENE